MVVIPAGTVKRQLGMTAWIWLFEAK